MYKDDTEEEEPEKDDGEQAELPLGSTVFSHQQELVRYGHDKRSMRIKKCHKSGKGPKGWGD